MIKKGNRKVFICILGFIWAIAVLFLVWLMFKSVPDVIIGVLAAMLTFGSTIVLYLFVSNYGEHREENRHYNNKEML